MQAQEFKARVRKDDMVQVMAGKDKGKRGKITRVLTKTQRVLVDGINLVTRHVRPNRANPQGGLMKKESPIHISNVMLVDPKTLSPTRIGKKFVEGKKSGKGKWVRVAKKSGTVLDQ